MPEFSGKVHAPILRLIAQELLELIKSDYPFRKLQGQNSAQACYRDDQSSNGGIATGTVYTIVQAVSGAEIFTALVITFDQASGAGRYVTDGGVVSPSVGHEVPSGGGILTITGHNNIKGFSLTPETATNLKFFRNLYK